MGVLATKDYVPQEALEDVAMVGDFT